MGKRWKIEKKATGRRGESYTKSEHFHIFGIRQHNCSGTG